MSETTWAGADFSAAACHVEGCSEPVLTYWRSCYADTALCRIHEQEISDLMFDDDPDGNIDFSCCWYPFAWAAGGRRAALTGAPVVH